MLISMVGTVVIAACLVLAPSAPAADAGFHPGIGYVVSQARHEVPEAAAQATPARPKAPPSPSVLALAPMGRPPTVLERVRGSRRARGLAIGAAIAVQAGMIIYGVASLLAQRGQADAEQERLYGDVPDWDPYPR